MIVVLCGAEGAKVQHEWAVRQDVDELHAVGFYPTALGRGIVVHQRPEAEVAGDLQPDLVVGGSPELWRRFAKFGDELVVSNLPLKKRGRPSKAS